MILVFGGRGVGVGEKSGQNPARKAHLGPGAILCDFVFIAPASVKMSSMHTPLLAITLQARAAQHTALTTASIFDM